MKRLYIDMDGTLAEWEVSASFEEVCAKGYFRNRKPMDNVVSAIKEIIKNYKDIEVFILSAVLDDNHSIGEKNEWLDTYIPEIDKDHRVFVKCGENKSVCIKNKGDILLDDYTKNLLDWEKSGGKGIKLLNGINWTKKSWKGDVVFCETNPKLLAESIVLLGNRRTV